MKLRTGECNCSESSTSSYWTPRGTRKKQLVITLKLALKPERTRKQVGIFVLNNASETHETVITFHDVNQLSRVLAFCVDKKDCGENCEFCSQLRTYVGNHWVKDPFVKVVNMGDTVLRKASLAMHLAQLVTFATGRSMAAPRIAAVPNDKGLAVVQIIPQLAALGNVQTTTKAKDAVICTAQNEVTAVLFDFFDTFPRSLVSATDTTSVSTTEL